MKSKVYTSPLAKRILLALGLVVLPLSVASQTQARDPVSIPGNATIAVVSIGGHRGMRIHNAAVLKSRVLYLITHKPEAVKALSKGCGCAAVAPQEASGFWGCLKRCMADAGVSYYSLIMCGAACALAETPPGAVLCAICVGVSVTVVEFCALGCAMDGGKGYGGLMDAKAIKHRRATSGSLLAKLRLQPARGKS